MQSEMQFIDIYINILPSLNGWPAWQIVDSVPRHAGLWICHYAVLVMLLGSCFR